ncbi:PAS domain S-box-containing protein [Pedobacter westerhofensis]|uniref:histidine kinase n=1 Tax=Pedobacter westerhofensis TaxID=425512 RepID=A0A521CY94_9SPHI|nr:PAS domain S-box protein [Pedobacter westerhofensis]SMO64403.1 PAS domain S-box-containing protein [Pedobacter westerhofensis]
MRINTKLKILHLEDLFSDAELVNRTLKKAKFDFERLVVDNRENFIKALTEFAPDIILSDHSLPSFNSHEALSIFKTMGLNIPFILITATVSEEFAVDVIKRGADDYILKDRLERLPTALANALEKFQLLKDHQSIQDNLVKNETLFRALIENSADAIIVINEQVEFIYQSPAVERLTGFDFTELVGKKLLDYIHPDDLEDYKLFFEQVLQLPGIAITNKFRFRQKNLGYIYTDGTITNLLHDKNVNALVINYRDNTKKIKAEEEKKALEILLDKATSLARIGSYEVDLENNTLYWSAITKQIHEVGDTYLPTVESATSFYKAGFNRDTISDQLKIVVSTGKTLDLELQIITAKGNERWVRIISEPDFINGKCVKIRGSFQDIDIRKRAELELLKVAEEKNMILESIGDGFFTLDTHWMITYWNKEAENILKKKREEVIGRNFWDLYHGSAGTHSHLSMLKASKESKVQNYEWFVENLNCWLDVTVYPSIQGLSIFFKDITERKLGEMERTKMVSDLLKRNNDLEQFSYIISHNLRAPVANIIGLAGELIRDQVLKGESNLLIDYLLASTQKLDTVIIDLNAILQVKREIIDSKENVVLSRLLEEVLTYLPNLIRQQKVKFIIDFSAGDELWTSKSFMHSIFYNLISNSIKYRRPMVNPIIEIKSERIGNKFILSFTDNGIGIDLEKNKSEIFGLYKRFHSHVEGKGMGLFMVKTQIETLGGSISVESKVNRGTQFRLELKVNPAG